MTHSDFESVQKGSTQEIVIAKEKEIWSGAKDKNVAALVTLFADDYLCIGYSPEGGIWRVSKSELGKLASLELQEYVLEDFQVIMADDRVAIVTYRAKGTYAGGAAFSLYATTVWANRKGDWQAVFYQATSDSSL